MYFDKFRQIVFKFYVRSIRQLCLNALAEASFHCLQVHPAWVNSCFLLTHRLLYALCRCITHGPMLVSCSLNDFFTLAAGASRLGRCLFLAHTSTPLRSMQMHLAWSGACFLLTHRLLYALCRCITHRPVLVACSYIDFFTLPADASRLVRCLFLAHT